MSYKFIVKFGGEGSGNIGHAGRPGEVGDSTAGGGGPSSKGGGNEAKSKNNHKSK